MAVKNLKEKNIYHEVLIKFQQNWLKQDAE
jgi:hypothetical protein